MRQNKERTNLCLRPLEEGLVGDQSHHIKAQNSSVVSSSNLYAGSSLKPGKCLQEKTPEVEVALEGRRDQKWRQG
jgi:hypothetical protein